MKDTELLMEFRQTYKDLWDIFINEKEEKEELSGFDLKCLKCNSKNTNIDFEKDIFWCGDCRASMGCLDFAQAFDEDSEKEEDNILICSNCKKGFNIFKESSSDTPNICDDCWSKENKDIDKKILSYDANEIHQACTNIGHSTGWESFTDELENYGLDDKKRLLEELKGVEIDN